MVDFRLKVFQTVARHLSFTKASNELFISQPAITRHIKELELVCKVKLFDRSGTRVSLTPGGILLLDYVNQILHLHDEALFELSNLSGHLKANLRIAASTTIAQYVLPLALARYTDLYPDINVTLLSRNSDGVEQLVLKNEADLGFVEGKNVNADIHYQPFMNDELVVFTAFQNKTYPQRTDVKGLVKLPMVLREQGSGTLEVIREAMANDDFANLNIVIHLGSTEGIKTFVKSGKGVGIVSRVAIENEVERGVFRLIQVTDIELHRQFHVIYPKGPEPVGIGKHFMDFMSRHYNLKL